MSARGGFTLIEVLAVIVLLALTAGSLAVNLLAASDSAAFRSTLAALRDLEERARLFARTEGPVVLRVEAEGQRLALRDAQGAELAAVECARAASVRLVMDPPSAALTYDRLGRTRDHELELRFDPERGARWRVCGESGWAVLLEGASEEAAR